MDAIFAAIQRLKDEAAEEAAAARRAAAPTPPVPPSPAPVPPVPPAQPPAAHHIQAPRAAGLLQGLFEDGNSLLRAVVAADVLSPPVALREPAHWNLQPNEPST